MTEKLSKSLARHGIRIHTHWSWDKKKPPQKFPDGIDLVYICTDMIGHNLANPCVDYARESGIPYVNGTRKWAESIERLTGAGFPLLEPLTVIPDLIAEVVAAKSFKEVAAGPTEADLKGLMVALTGQTDPTTASILASESRMPSSITMAAAINAPIAHSTPLNPPAKQETTPMPNANAAKPALAMSDVRQQIYLRALINDPTIGNVDLWEVVRKEPIFQSRQFDPQRAGIARDQLGISIVRKNGERRVSVNSKAFNATAAAIGVKDYKAPQTVYVMPDRAPPPTPPTAASAPAHVETAAPVAAPVAPAPAAPTKVDGMEELKDLLTLVRVKMAEECITELHLTPEGVKFKQVKVVEGEIAV